MLNHRMISADEHVHMDRNLANFVEEMNNPLTPNTPASAEQLEELKTLMLRRLKHNWNLAEAGHKLYQPTAWLQRYVTMGDCQETIANIKAIDPKAMRAKLDSYPSLTDAQKAQAVAQLVAKRRILPKVMEEFLDWIKTNPPAPNDWAVPVSPVLIAPPPQVSVVLPWLYPVVFEFARAA